MMSSLIAFVSVNIIIPFCVYTVGCTVIGGFMFMFDTLSSRARFDPHKMQEPKDVINFGAFGGSLCATLHLLYAIYTKMIC